jgi:hypothetical protein
MFTFLPGPFLVQFSGPFYLSTDINHYKNCSATYSFDQNALKLKYFKKI